MQVETDFASALLDPAAPVPAAVTGRTPRRYAVYRNNVTVGLVRALEANFPALRRLLGEAYFAGLARAFVQSHPPKSPLLFHYGEGFAEHVAGQEDLAQFPYLPDVARLEQLWRTAYHARDARVLDPAALSLAPEALMAVRFEAHPASAVLASSFAVHAIFAANRGGDGAVSDPARPEAVLVTRPRLDVTVTLLSTEQFEFISALREGTSLADAAERGFAASESFDLADTIRLVVEAGAFHRIIIQDQQ
jgi:hypothetical protein